MSDDQTACRHCGEVIESRANFCRHCGSSEQDGWRDDDYDELLADDDFDYDEFVRDEFSGSTVNMRTSALWRWVAFILLGLAALGFVLI
tara:strand:+ start:211626 stop:211892 length:267 start_codon:yes stop_codon:yes gene_type:complete